MLSDLSFPLGRYDVIQVLIAAAPVPTQTLYTSWHSEVKNLIMKIEQQI